jgi:hypothetical protein
MPTGATAILIAIMTTIAITTGTVTAIILICVWEIVTMTTSVEIGLAAGLVARVESTPVIPENASRTD